MGMKWNKKIALSKYLHNGLKVKGHGRLKVAVKVKNSVIFWWRNSLIFDTKKDSDILSDNPDEWIKDKNKLDFIERGNLQVKVKTEKDGGDS